MRYEPFESSLQQGTLIRRYKRFLADVELDGETIVAHCPNSGSMLGMNQPGIDVLVRHVEDPKRKLQWTLEMVHPGTWVGCNTMRPNGIVEWAIQSGQVPSIAVPETLRREVKYGKNSRIDLLLDDSHYVEVKNTTLARPSAGPVPEQLQDAPEGVALFPDAVTARGAKHMQELADMVDAGHDATVVFLVNRADCNAFAVARDLDPKYAEAFQSALDQGVQAVALATDPGPQGWAIRGELPIM